MTNGVPEGVGVYVPTVPVLECWCQRVGELAILEPDLTLCRGWIAVKGDGILPKDDLYNKPYVRRCPLAPIIGGVEIIRKPGSTVIIDCREVDTRSLRVGSGLLKPLSEPE